MELNFVIIIGITILLIYLVFKFIKKLVMAIITAILVVGLIFGGVLGLAFFDLKSLSEQTQFDVDLVYVEDDSYLTGISFPIKDSELVMEEVSKVSKSDFEAYDLDDIDKDDNRFVVTVEKEFYGTLLTKETYELSDFIGESEVETISDYELSLSKSQLLDLIESKTASEDLIGILLSQNEIPAIMEELAEKTLASLLDTSLETMGVGLNEALFAGLFKVAIEGDSSNVLTLIEGYKDGEMNVYPDRFSFSLIRMLPAGFLASKLDDSSSEN